MRTVDLARNKWVGLLTEFGINKDFLTNRGSPCPVCDGKDRFRFDDKEGRGTYFCNHCGPGDGIDLLMKFKGWDFKTAAINLDQKVSFFEPQEPTKAQDTERIKKRLNRIESGLQSVGRFSPVKRYLSARGLERIPRNFIHYHQGLTYYNTEFKPIGVFPAMVAAVTARTGEFLTYHITYLTAHGSKADVPNAKKMMSPLNPIAGGAVRLTKIHPHIGLAEGIETAIAVMNMYGIPCWASVSTAGMESFEPPGGIRAVTIFGDNDESFSGQKSGFALAKKLKNKGYHVSVALPDENGDFLDQKVR